MTPAGSGRGAAGDLALPIGWALKEEAEQRFTEAEEVRLLYVAATRAREELVVARWPGGRGTSTWAAFDPWLDEHAEHLTLAARDPAEKEEVGDHARRSGGSGGAGSGYPGVDAGAYLPAFVGHRADEEERRAGVADVEDAGWSGGPE